MIKNNKDSNIDKFKNILEDDPTIIDELIEDSPATQEHVISTLQQKLEIHSGPLPSPETLREYKEIDEDLFRTIITMAKNQSDHRIEIEKQVISSDIQSQKRGQWFVFVLFFIIIIASFGLIYIGKNAVGITGVVSALIGGVALFLGTKQKQEQAIKNKDSEMFNNLPGGKNEK